MAFELLPKRLRDALRKRGIESPTRIQELAIPVILKGFNALIMAPTGSGKTEAALLPVASKIIENNMYGKLRALYITPLRALNRDIGIRGFELLKDVGIEVDVWHGDTPYSRRRRIAEAPPEVLVTTPESLNILLVNKKMREHLKDVKFVIVDELHELIEDKRGSELAVALERLSLIAKFQRVGLSATISQVDEARKFLGGFRYVVEVRDESQKAPEIAVYVEEGFENMVQKVKELVNKVDGTTLIVTNTRDTAESLGKKLREELEGVEVHHGSLSKRERERVERLAREGKLKAIVATASLELGIDIGSIKHVIQFSSPRRVTNLIQRVGRAEHKPTERPKGSLVTGIKPYEAFEAAVIARRAKAGNLEPLSIHKNPLDVLAHQIVGILMEEERFPVQVYDIVRKAYPFWNLSYDDFYEVFNLLRENKLVTCDGPCKATKKGEIYYRTTGMIVESRRYEVVIYGTNETVGSLDEEFVVELNPGDRFVLAGRVWRVVGVDEEKVFVEEDEGEGPPPSWEGELIPVDYNVAREVGALKRSFDLLIKNYPVKNEEKLKEYLDSIKAPIANDKRVVIEVEGNLVVYNVHGGSKVNLTLAYALSELARMRYGSASFNTTPYHIMLYLAKPISPQEAEDLLRSIRKLGLRRLVESSLRTSKLYSWRLMKVLVRMGLLDRKRVTLEDLKKVERALKRMYLDKAPGRETVREIVVDKLDLDKAEKYLEELERGSIEVVSRKGFSEQSKWALDKGFAKDHSSDPKPVIREAVKRRLENREVTLICLSCGYEFKGKVKDVPLKCPKCGRGVLVPIYGERELVEATKRFVKGERVNKKLLDEIRSRARLFTTYRRDALVALAGRGIGTRTASKILADYYSGKKDLIDAIIDAEKTYLRTKRFW